jgi:Replication protein
MVEDPPKDEGPSWSDDRPSGIAELPRRVERYGGARKRALDVRDAIPSDRDPARPYDAKARFRLNYCGDHLLFRHYAQADQVRLHAARFCQLHLLCPLCAIRRGAKALESYLDRYEVIQTEKTALRPFLVTLTVKDGPDLLERFRHLKGSFQRLIRRGNRRAGSALHGVAGGVWSYEVKRGKGSGLWHPHLHMVALAEVQPNKFDLADEWERLTGDSYIVDVRPIEGDPVAGFLEVFKYAVKFSDMEPRDTVHAWRLLRGARLIDSSGVFRGVEIPEELTDEDMEGPYTELLYRYLRESGGYSFVERSEQPGGSPQGGARCGVPPTVNRGVTQVPDWKAWARRFHA